VLRSFQDISNGGERQQGSGGVVGIGDEQGAGFIAEIQDDFLEGELHIRSVAQDVNLRAKNLGVVAVHGESRLTDKNAGASFDEGVEKNAQGIVAAIGQEKLFGFDAEVAGEALRGALILGIHGEQLGRKFRERANDGGGAARRVFVEVQAEVVGAAFRGRLV